MQTYTDFQPTGFDQKGLNLDSQQNWLVLPTGRNRDSDSLQESNFQTALDLLGGESDNVEVCSFNHWACGWFEIIIINPYNPCKNTAFLPEHLKTAYNIESDLEDYPVLDEQDYSERQWQQGTDYWLSMDLSERVELCQKYNVNTLKARHDDIPDDSSLEEYLIYSK